MIPILYEKNETAFLSNGLGRLYDCVSCIVTEERNGIYECDFEYPASGPKFKEIYPGRIIACLHDETGDIQPFDIVSYSAPINGVVQFHAVHISYRQSFLTVSGRNITTLAAAFSRLSQSTPANPFSYETDKTGNGLVAAFDGVPRTVRQMLGGIDGSILDSFHGEYEFDKFRVILHSARGEYKPLTIRYGVNMIDFTNDVDYSESFVSTVPYWIGDDGNGGETVVTGAVVRSGLPSYNDRDDCVPLDLSEKFETKPTAAQLRSAALSLMQSQDVNLPSQTIDVDFVRLQESSEYEQFALLMSCNLCDWIRVVFPQYGISGMYKIVSTEYDVLRGRYNKMELGNLSASLSSVLGGSDSLFSERSGGGGCPFPINAIYMSMDSTNPSALWEGTTWTRISQGRVLTGVNENDTAFETAGKTGGEKTHLLTKEESGLPSHGHGFTQPKIPNHQHALQRQQLGVQTGSTNRYFASGSTVGGNTATDGGGGACTGGAVSNNNGSNAASAHNNLQPYLTCYIWQRTA